MSKFSSAIEGTSFSHLGAKEQTFIEEKANSLNLSFQEIRNIIDDAVNLRMWGESPISKIWPNEEEYSGPPTQRKKKLMAALGAKMKELVENKSYSNFSPEHNRKNSTSVIQQDSDHTILGSCPVASEKTRCCNLKTLDAVRNCGFDCSYCSIQSFYYDDKVYFDAKLSEKLKNLSLDKNQIYHIGTGQSSDSLMWGNTKGLLDDLFSFAKKNPNIILELKTKSNNISYLLENEIPKNIVTTWSLNPNTIIQNEEHLTATLEERLEAAKQIQQNGNLIGFHFHPMVQYQGWEKEYQAIANKIANEFSSDLTALVSMGTLTFIRPAIKKLKKRMMKSKILQMPLKEIAGKMSYPYEVKKELFQTLYNSFPKEWHRSVFFYMCMEDINLWDDVFGYSYQSNDEFEKAMIDSYWKKIQALRQSES